MTKGLNIMCVCVCVCVCVCMNHFAVQQKLTQHCKSTICQFEKLIKKRIHTGNPVLYNDLREKNLKMSGYMYMYN